MSPAPRRRVTLVIHLPFRWVAFEWLARDLDRRRFEPSVVLISPEPHPAKATFEALGVDTTTLTYRASNHLRHTLFRLPSLVWRLSKILRRLRPDVVHSHFGHAPLAVAVAGRWAAPSARILHTRHVAGPHPWPPRGLQTRIFTRLQQRLSHRVVAISALVEQALLDDGVPQAKIRNIPHGFDLAAFRDVEPRRIVALRRRYDLPAEGGPVVGVVARFVELKGIHHTLAAFERLLATHPTAVLVLAGTFGAHQDWLHGLVDRLPSERVRRIHFEEDLFALYRLFDVFVHVPIAPHVEAFGQVYVEALAAGVPSIFTRSGIAHELAEDGSNCWLVEHGDVDGIAQGLRNLLDRPRLRERLVEGGLETAQNYGLETMIGRHAALYSESDDKRPAALR